MNLFDDLINIIFPRLCCACEDALTKNEELLCFRCRSALPKIKDQSIHENELTERLLGKVKVNFGLAYLYFFKTGITQKLLHELKYRKNTDVGEVIGSWFGHEMLKKKINDEIDIIIPVPLHRKKERKRGYNQSKFIAQGISKVWNVGIENKALVRTTYQTSQTQKTKEQRWKNVQYAFEVNNRKAIEGKRILLVDDVITTGATLEACYNKLIENKAESVSIATLALAK